MLGASDVLFENCLIYLRILTAFAPAYILQVMFQVFFVTAGHPGLGMFLTILAGCVNAVCDYWFMAGLNMGIAGAAWATALGYIIPAVAGVVFLSKIRASGLNVRYLKEKPYLKSCSNGSSEMVSNLAMSVVNLMFNWYMIKMAGEKGVAAISIVLYAQFIFHSIYIGFSNGVAPVISYNYGEQNHIQLKRLYRICMKFILAVSVVACAGSLVFADPIASILLAVMWRPLIWLSGALEYLRFPICLQVLMFLPPDFSQLYPMGRYQLLFHLCVPLFSSSSHLPYYLFFLGIDGVWLAVPVAEVLAFALSLLFMIRKRSFTTIFKLRFNCFRWMIIRRPRL